MDHGSSARFVAVSVAAFREGQAWLEHGRLGGETGLAGFGTAAEALRHVAGERFPFRLFRVVHPQMTPFGPVGRPLRGASWRVVEELPMEVAISRHGAAVVRLLTELATPAPATASEEELAARLDAGIRDRAFHRGDELGQALWHLSASMRRELKVRGLQEEAEALHRLAVSLPRIESLARTNLTPEMRTQDKMTAMSFGTWHALIEGAVSRTLLCGGPGPFRPIVDLLRQGLVPEVEHDGVAVYHPLAENRRLHAPARPGAGQRTL